ncbi:thiamine-phosphate kinase [Aneurinibacillus tyrosinisolvens]|uniref:thiamine-phosphate kinase n=1 Tax=Aneurinibacillus tyrosinisolvens TaxID=1443435 RepID=UPI00063F95E1|nr:thiamine-phosphate kinase [Aneurinibacillus tyrosinisolvens]
MSEKRRDEFALISYLTAGRSIPEAVQSRIVVGNGDDAAVVTGKSGYDWVACCDTMVEEVHFKRKTMQPHEIGHKALASNVSDIAAMGGIPLFYLISLGVSPEWCEEELAGIYQGMERLASRYGMALIGGDTVAVPGPLTITVTVLGEVERNKPLLRSAAKPGDLVFLTGTVGDSGAGLDLLLQGKQSIKDEAKIEEQWLPLIERHCLPEPQVAAGRILSQSGHRIALDDISDGVASEAWEIAQASGVSLVLDEQSVPLSEEMKRYAGHTGREPWPWVWYGGEDYQLIGCAPPEAQEELAEQFKRAGLPLYWVGQAVEGEAAVFLRQPNGDKIPLHKKGYNHFNEL